MSFLLLDLKAFDRRDASSTNLRTSHPQLSNKSHQNRERDSENEIMSYKEYITGEKVKIIEIIFLFCLSAAGELPQES